MQETRASTPPRLGRIRRALGGIAASFLLGTVFVGASISAVLLHLDLPSTRRIVREAANQVLGSLFEGAVVIEQLDHVRLSGVDVGSARVLDPRGETVIVARGIHARADILAITASALGRGRDLRITITRARIDEADVLIEPSASGHLGVEEAFRLRPPTAPPSPPPAPGPPGRAVRVYLPAIEIGHAHAHGALAPPRSLESDVSRVAAAIRIEPEGFTLDVSRAGLVDRGFLGATTVGTADYHLRLLPASATGNPGVLRMWTEVAAEVGAVQTQARATLENGRLTAILDVPSATPTDLASLLPGLALTEPATLHVELDGPIPSFDVKLAAWLHPAWGAARELHASGHFEATSPVRADLDLDWQGLDPRALDGRLPSGRFSGEGRLVAELTSPPRVAIDARTELGVLANELVPPAAVHVDLVRGGVVAGLALDETGAPITAFIELTRSGALGFDASADIPSLRAAPRLARVADGAASVRVVGTLQDGQLDARVDGVGRGLSLQGLSLGGAQIHGRVAGPLDALSIEADLRGDTLSAAGYDFRRATVHADGPITALRVVAGFQDERGGDVAASGSVDVKGAVVRSVKVSLARGEEHLAGTIARIDAGPHGVSVEGIALAGSAVGTLTGGLALGGGDLTGTLRGSGVDLARLSQLVGHALPVHGLADVDLELHPVPGGGRRGHVQLEIEEAGAYGLEGVSAHLTATVEGESVKADGLLRLVGDGAPTDATSKTPSSQPAPVNCDGVIAELQLAGGEGRLRGPLLALDTWKRLTGGATLSANDWKLACLRTKVPGLSVLLTELTGTLSAQAYVARPEGQRFPSLPKLVVGTRGFQIGGPRTGILDGTPRWALSCDDRDKDHPCTPIDGRIDGSVDGATGKTSVELNLLGMTVDSLAKASVEATLDLATLADKPALRWASLKAAPFLANISIADNDAAVYAGLPSLVRDALPPFTGKIKLDVYADGSLAQPFLSAKLRGTGLAIADSLGATTVSPFAMPFDIDALATYDANHGTLDATLSQATRKVATVTGELDAALAQLLASGPDAKPRWTGGVYAKVEDVSLHEMAGLGARDISGHLSGTLSLSGLNKDPKAELLLQTSDLVLGADEPPQQGRFAIAVSGGAIVATTRLAPTNGQGSLTFAANASVDWLGGLVPSVNFERAGAFILMPRAFGLGALRPLVADWVRNLGGELDGDAKIEWSRLAQGDAASVTANLTVVKGVVNLPQLGQELHDVKLRVTASPGKPIELFDLDARGLSGSISGSGNVELDGLRFRKARANLTIADELPLTFEGVAIGNARGLVDVTVDKHPDELAFDVNIPKLHVELPTSPRMGVQSLDDNPDIVIAPRLAPPKAVRPANALRIAVTVRGQEIQVEGETIGGGKGLDLVLRTRTTPDGTTASPPHLVLADELRVSGDIELVRGKIDIYGKLFELDQGLVRLRPEDASNPYINVLAHWDAPDGSRITVGWTGPLDPMTDDKLLLRSDPPRVGGRQEILTALLFGVTPDEASAPSTPTSDSSQQGTGVGTAAVGVGGGLATAQLSALLSGTMLRGLSARFGTTATGSLATTLQYQLGQTVIAAATFENAAGGATTASGAQQGGAPQSSTTTQTSTMSGTRTELSIDWRFAAKLSLRATLGMTADQPSSGLDLLWQHRY